MQSEPYLSDGTVHERHLKLATRSDFLRLNLIRLLGKLDSLLWLKGFIFLQNIYWPLWKSRFFFSFWTTKLIHWFSHLSPTLPTSVFYQPLIFFSSLWTQRYWKWTSVTSLGKIFEKVERSISSLQMRMRFVPALRQTPINYPTLRHKLCHTTHTDSVSRWKWESERVRDKLRLHCIMDAHTAKRQTVSFIIKYSNQLAQLARL